MSALCALLHVKDEDFSSTVRQRIFTLSGGEKNQNRAQSGELIEQPQVKTTSANLFWSQTTSVNSTLNTATALCSGLCDVWRSINSG